MPETFAEQLAQWHRCLERYGMAPTDVIWAESVARKGDGRRSKQAARRAEMLKSGVVMPRIGGIPGSVTHDVMALFLQDGAPTWSMDELVCELTQWSPESIKRIIRKLRNEQGMIVWCDAARVRMRLAK